MFSDVAKTIALVGKTGSGKGTQAELLANKLGYTSFSTGDQFRKLRLREDALGDKVREIYDQGHLFPGWFASYLFEDALFSLEGDAGIVFEGMGRSVEESQMFEEVTSWLGRGYTIIELQISDQTAKERMRKRKRDDMDSEEYLDARLIEYKEKTAPAIEYFRSIGKLLEVDGEPSVEEVFKNISKALNIS